MIVGPPPRYRVSKTFRLMGVGCCGFGLLGSYVYSGLVIASAGKETFL